MKTKVELALDHEAIAQLERSVERRQPSKGDSPAMRKMLAQDRKDWRKIITLYKTGKWKQAMDVASGMDSEPRDYIPDGIWKHLELATY